MSNNGKIKMCAVPGNPTLLRLGKYGSRVVVRPVKPSAHKREHHDRHESKAHAKREDK